MQLDNYRREINQSLRLLEISTGYIKSMNVNNTILDILLFNYVETLLALCEGHNISGYDYLKPILNINTNSNDLHNIVNYNQNVIISVSKAYVSKIENSSADLLYFKEVLSNINNYFIQYLNH